MSRDQPPDWPGPGYATGAPAGYADPFTGPLPETSGVAVGLKWGLLFGLLAGVLDLLQVLASAAAVSANQSALDAWVQNFGSYSQCVQNASDPTTCTPPQADPAITQVPLVFFGTCCLAFLLTLVAYFFAGQLGARAALRRTPGILAAGIAGVTSCVLYALFGALAANATGRSALLFGLSAAEVSLGQGGFSLANATVQIDLCAFPLTIGFAILVGLWGSALGMSSVEAEIAAIAPRIDPYGPYGAGYGTYGPMQGYPPPAPPYGTGALPIVPYPPAAPYGPGGPPMSESPPSTVAPGAPPFWQDRPPPAYSPPPAPFGQSDAEAPSPPDDDDPQLGSHDAVE
jgi:hypothetical protein